MHQGLRIALGLYCDTKLGLHRQKGDTRARPHVGYHDMKKQVDIPDRPGYIIVYEGTAGWPYNIQFMSTARGVSLKNDFIPVSKETRTLPPHWIWQKANGKYGRTLYDSNVKEYIRVTPSVPYTPLQPPS